MGFGRRAGLWLRRAGNSAKGGLGGDVYVAGLWGGVPKFPGLFLTVLIDVYLVEVVGDVRYLPELGRVM